MLAPVKLNRDS